MSSEFEPVHMIYDYYDGILSGIADLNGVPHYFQVSPGDNRNDYYDIFFLKPISNEGFQLATEDWEIWKRWYAALEAGETTAQTHPALPEDRARHSEIRALLSEHLTINVEKDVKMRGDFHVDRSGNYPKFSSNPRSRVKVKWSAIS